MLEEEDLGRLSFKCLLIKSHVRTRGQGLFWEGQQQKVNESESSDVFLGHQHFF